MLQSARVRCSDGDAEECAWEEEVGEAGLPVRPATGLARSVARVTGDVILPLEARRRRCCVPWLASSFGKSIMCLAGLALYTLLIVRRKTLLQDIGLETTGLAVNGASVDVQKPEHGKDPAEDGGEEAAGKGHGRAAILPAYDGKAAFREAGERIALRKYEKGGCVAVLLDAAFALADASVLSVAANEDCNEIDGEPREDHTEAAKHTLEELKRALETAQEVLKSKTPQGHSVDGVEDHLREEMAKVAHEVDRASRHLGNRSREQAHTAVRLPDFKAPGRRAHRGHGSEKASHFRGVNVLKRLEDAHAEEVHAEEAHAEKAHAEEAHVEVTHAKEAHAEEVHAEEAHAEEAHMELVHEKEIRREEAHHEDEHIDPFDPHINLYSPRRRAQVRCARDTLFLVQAVAATSARVSSAVGLCPDDKTNVHRAPCAANILNSILYLTEIGGSINEMILVCIPGKPFFECAFWLEEIAWDIAAAGKFLSGAVKACDPDFRISTKPKLKKSLYDYGWCVGEVFGTMGYVGATSLHLTSAVRFNCPKASELMLKKGNRLNPEELEEIRISRAECARDSAAFVRTLFLAATKATRTASHCGGKPTRCPKDLLRASSAFAAVAEAAAEISRFCTVASEFRDDEPDEERKVRKGECAVFTGGMVKMMGIAASFTTDATGSCIDTHFAGTRCGGAISRAVAALASMAEFWAEVHVACDLEEDWFICGEALRNQGKSIRVFVLATASAALNCGLAPLSEAWKATRQLPMPRIFTYP